MRTHNRGCSALLLAWLACGIPAGAAGRTPADGDVLGAAGKAMVELGEAWAIDPRSRDTLAAMLRGVDLARQGGRRDHAERLLSRCRVLAGEILDAADPLGAELAYQELRLIKSRARTGERTGARAFYEEGLARLGDGSGYASLRADLHQGWANHLRSEGDLVGALRFYDLSLATRGPEASLARAGSLTWRGLVERFAGRDEAARASLLRAAAVLDTLGLEDCWLRCTIEANLAWFAEASGDAPRAMHLLEEALAQCEGARRGLPVGPARRGYAVGEHRARLAILYRDAGRPGAAWDVLQEDRTVPRGSARSPHPAAPPLTARGGALDADEIAGLREEMEDLFRRRERADAAPTAPAVDRPAFQAGLGPDRAAVCWVDVPRPTGDSFWAVVLRGAGDPVWVDLEATGSGGDNARRAIGRIRGRVTLASEWPFPVEEDPALLADARLAGAFLWDPIAESLAGASMLILLPPSGRVLPELTRDADGVWLGERFRLVGSPSAGPPRRAPVAIPPRTALLLGSRSAEGLVPLPGVTRELAAVGAVFPGATVLEDPRSDRVRVLVLSDSLSHFDVVHLATHAEVDPRIPERSWLALRDARLRADEILSRWSLDAELVTLSACRTAPAPTTGTDYLGFARAFLGAGARSVLMTRWRVPDEVAASLMTRFYTNWVEGGMSRAGALQEAQIWLRTREAPDGTRPWAHPVYWAGFVLYGEG